MEERRRPEPPGADDWKAWCPPLNPPDPGGVPLALAERARAMFWPGRPHCMAAMLWDRYAATLPPTVVAAAVTTGMQSVTFGGPTATGAAGTAMARADWHRERCNGGSLVAVPLVSTLEALEADGELEDY